MSQRKSQICVASSGAVIQKTVIDGYIQNMILEIVQGVNERDRGQTEYVEWENSVFCVCFVSLGG